VVSNERWQNGTGDMFGEGSPRARKKRVLLIDYDEQLAEVFGELLKDDGLEVVAHNCGTDRCDCADKALEVSPDLVLVNVAQPSGWLADLHGWHCLQEIKADPRTKGYELLGYSILDPYTLYEAGIDPHNSGVRIRAGVSNPGQFADEIARVLQSQRVA
jgi:CheY-like chemotaxis protein